MFETLRLWQLLIVAAAGWVNRNQQAFIHYLQEENRVLREQLGSKRLRLTDDQRRRRGMPWKTFTQAQWHTICAADFFTVEVWGLRGLVTFYVLLVIEHSADACTSPELRQIRTRNG